MSEREESQHEVITISDDECDIQSEPSMAWLLNNDVKDDNQATSRYKENCDFLLCDFRRFV